LASARRALNALEIGVLSLAGTEQPFDLAVAQESIQKKAIQYDATGDDHYDAASALIKSMRGSDPDAAIYWLARMLEAGEDPRFLARRIVIAAAEDVGNADPTALILANAAAQATEFVGLPECRILLAQRRNRIPPSRQSMRRLPMCARNVCSLSRYSFATRIMPVRHVWDMVKATNTRTMRPKAGSTPTTSASNEPTTNRSRAASKPT
jgi:hypothetical protein